MTDLDTILRVMTAGFQQINERLDRLEERVGNLEIKLDQMDQRVGNLEIKLDQMDQRVGNLETKLDQMDQRVGNLETKLDQMDQRVGNLETKLDQMDQRVGNLETDTKQIKLQTGNLEAKTASLETEMRQEFADMRARLDALQQTVDRIEHQQQDEVVGMLRLVKGKTEIHEYKIDSLNKRLLEAEANIQKVVNQ
jgi:chromosome segregation ATPase